MKCAVCGKEFGSGINCQNCGTDRVTGLANYSGYDRPNSSLGDQSNYTSQSNNVYASPNTMVCYACSEIISANSEYFPYCSTQLYVTCPKCGNKYSSQFPACNKCGTNRVKYLKKLKAEEEEARRKENEKRTEQSEMESAQELRNQLFGTTIIWWVLIFILVPPLLFLIFELTPITMMGIYGIGAIGGYIIYRIYEFRINKWKEEHPNDPRSKYL